MNKIIFQPNSVILLIGISNSGKSTFYKEHLYPFFNGHNIDFEFIQNHDITQLESYIKYPTNTNLVIIEDNQLDIEQWNTIINTTKNNHYNLITLIFDYQNKSDFLLFSNDKEIFKSIKDFRNNILPIVHKNFVSNKFIITNNNFSSYELVYEEYIHNIADTNRFDRYCIISDIHGCFDEFLECVIDNKGLYYDKLTGLLSVTSQSEYYHHIINGDYLDKGPKIKETIKFLYDNRQFFYIIKGNHENSVFKLLNKEIELEHFLITKYFNSYFILKDDPIYKEMFFELYRGSFDYIEGKKFIVTHSPCEIKYLGKKDPKSIRNQRTFVMPKLEHVETTEEFLTRSEEALKFVLTEADENHKKHFFGHIPCKEIFQYKNKFCIDTGCYLGNKLTSIKFNNNFDFFGIKYYESYQPKLRSVHNLFRNIEI